MWTENKKREMQANQIISLNRKRYNQFYYDEKWLVLKKCEGIELFRDYSYNKRIQNIRRRDDMTFLKRLTCMVIAFSSLYVVRVLSKMLDLLP